MKAPLNRVKNGDDLKNGDALKKDDDIKDKGDIENAVDLKYEHSFDNIDNHQNKTCNIAGGIMYYLKNLLMNLYAEKTSFWVKTTKTHFLEWENVVYGLEAMLLRINVATNTKQH